MDDFFANLKSWLEIPWVNDYIIPVILAIVVLIIGRWVAKIITSVIKRLLTKRNAEGTIVSFVSNLSYIALMTFVVLAALSKLGIQTTSFIAIIGAAGLAIGLALQGSLANFAAGFLMIIFHPFKVGDFIEGAGTSGVVEEIQVFSTKLKTPDNKSVIIPNAKLTGDNIINYSAKDTRRVDMVFGVGYDDDLQKVRQVLNGIIGANSHILKDPEPVVVVGELGDNSVNFTVRVWVKTADYWDVFFSTTEEVKKQFDDNGISIPYPQRDVYLYQKSSS
jgi:small conductance mechanosensitive channel